MAFNDSKNPNKSLPVCVGYEKTLPGRIPLFKLIQIDSQMKSFEGKVVSVGASTYCGRMVSLGKLPNTTTGFQIRISYDGQATPSSSYSAVGQTPPSTARQGQGQLGPPATEAAAASSMPKDPLEVLKDVDARLMGVFSPLLSSCGDLSRKALESTQRRFLPRFWENMKELGTSARDTGRRVGEGSGRLLRMAADKLSKERDGDGADGQPGR
jgi:hypothetical protein